MIENYYGNERDSDLLWGCQEERNASGAWGEMDLGLREKKKRQSTPPPTPSQIAARVAQKQVSGIIKQTVKADPPRRPPREFYKDPNDDPANWIQQKQRGIGRRVADEVKFKINKATHIPKYRAAQKLDPLLMKVERVGQKIAEGVKEQVRNPRNLGEIKAVGIGIIGDVVSKGAQHILKKMIEARRRDVYNYVDLPPARSKGGRKKPAGGG